MSAKLKSQGEIGEASANGIKLAYTSYGDKSHPTVLLVQGLGTSSVGWPPTLIDYFTDRGFRVVTFDNRDIGHSQLMNNAGVPNVAWALLKQRFGFSSNVPYTLHDMALDTIGLLDYLDIESAHVVGVSMGGMIAQRLAIAAPNRVATLCSVMSTTNNRSLPPPLKNVSRHMLTPQAKFSYEQRVLHQIQFWRLVQSPGYLGTDEIKRELVEALLERGVTRDGVARQLLAIIAEPDRRAELRTVKIPTLVIHGSDDPLVPQAAGEDTAAAIPGAKLEVIRGMGHDLPLALVPTLGELIVSHIHSSTVSKKHL